MVINSVLISMPFYVMFFYKFSMSVRDRIDGVRRIFLWKGKREALPCLVNWDEVCISKA